MAEYRAPEFTLDQRAGAALRMLHLGREWGLVSKLARLYGVSRTLLYEIRDRALDAIVETLLPRDAGRPAQATTLTVDKAFIDRTIAILPMLKGSVRDIRLGLALILGVTRSVGYVSETLTAADEQATVYNLGVTVPLPILGEADEIFQGRQVGGLAGLTPTPYQSGDEAQEQGISTAGNRPIRATLVPALQVQVWP